MKAKTISFLLLAGLTVAQPEAAQDPARKSHQELEIMKGILSTTLGFIADEARREARTGGSREPYVVGRSFRSSNISAFYLRGQGAVFVMPMSSLRLRRGILRDELVVAGELQYAQAREALELQRMRAEDLAHEMEAKKAAGTGKAKTDDPEKYRIALRAYQDKAKERRTETEHREKAYQELLSQAKMHLIEALANHGDSLTHVGPDEYINLVLTSSRGESVLLMGELYAGAASSSDERARAGRQIISVQKSFITDYKAGRLTLDGFKQKVLQYFD